MINNPTFYPTPPKLIERMMKKIQGNPFRILEPSAGKGDIIKALERGYWDEDIGHRGGHREFHNIWAIEKDEDLQAVLRGKNIKILDSDFLTFSGPDKFDLIIANPPFDEGDKHLLKAIDIMYSGQIIFLLNAETIRNLHTRTRTQLGKKLKKMGAEIEYIKGAFKDAERPTDVEIALVNIIIERKVEEDLFAGADDKAQEVKVEVAENYELITGRRVQELVLEYNQLVRIATETILQFYKNHRKIGKYLKLEIEHPSEHFYLHGELTGQVQQTVNAVVATIRTDFWKKTLDLPEVTRRLTKAKADEFYAQVNKRCEMDFTESNIRTFVLNIIKGYNATLRDAILAMFDKFSVKHSYRDVPWEENIHYFNGWKTNKAFKVGRRVVIPVHFGYDEGPFRNHGEWSLDWNAASYLRDIDIVMNYFDGMNPNYYSIAEALQHAFRRSENSTESTYFSKITAYKKGTLHLTFASEDILRRFNIEACKGKNWLPDDYGEQRYANLDPERRALVDEFEGEESYNNNFGRIGMDCPSLPAIEAPITGQLDLFAA